MNIKNLGLINLLLPTWIFSLVIIPDHHKTYAQNQPKLSTNQKSILELSRFFNSGIIGKNECPRELSSIPTIVPELTKDRYLTFSLYVPKLSENFDLDKFSLQDIDNSKNVYGKASIFTREKDSFRVKLLPHSEYSFKLGTQYRWLFTAYCHEDYAMSVGNFVIGSGVVETKAKIKPDELLI